MPDIPAPPMPTMCTRCSSSGSGLALTAGAFGLRRCGHVEGDLGHPLRGVAVADQRGGRRHRRAAAPRR